MPFEMLFDRDHKVLLVRFGRALTGDEMFGVARLYGRHQSNSQGEEPMVVRDLQEAYDLPGLKDPDFRPFEITDRSPE